MDDRVILDRPTGFVVWWKELNRARFISTEADTAWELSESEIKDLKKLIAKQEKRIEHENRHPPPPIFEQLKLF